MSTNKQASRDLLEEVRALIDQRFIKQEPDPKVLVSQMKWFIVNLVAQSINFITQVTTVQSKLDLVIDQLLDTNELRPGEEKPVRMNGKQNEDRLNS